MRFLIYKITNLVNGKQYVGQTTRSIAERFNKHCHSKQPIGRAIRKYGKENFKIEIIDHAETKEELNELEMYWIAELDTKAPNGYNLTDGGEGCVGHTHSEETKQKMSEAKKGENNPMYGKSLSEEHRQKISEAHRKPVLMFDKNTGGFIREFISAREAMRWLQENGKPKAGHSHISNCCNGNRGSAYGYKWIFKEDDINDFHE